MYFSTTYLAKGKLAVKAGDTAFRILTLYLSPSTTKSCIKVKLLLSMSCALIPGLPHLNKSAEGDKYSIHILNAVSPAFTASFPFARYVVKEYIDKNF
jgi:hypothetical protein